MIYTYEKFELHVCVSYQKFPLTRDKTYNLVTKNGRAHVPFGLKKTSLVPCGYLHAVVEGVPAAREASDESRDIKLSRSFTCSARNIWAHAEINRPWTRDIIERKLR